MLRDLAILVVIGVIALLVAAGGGWSIVAVCIAVFILLPATVIGLWRHFDAANRSTRLLLLVRLGSQRPG